MIELLVVIAIIAILAGLLLPALIGAKRKAQTVVCANNFNQLQLAWHFYSEDFDGRVPRNYGTRSAGRQPNYPSWVTGALSYDDETDNTNTYNLTHGIGTIGKYSRDGKIYKCPADLSKGLVGFARHPRVRSVSLNSYVGSPYIGAELKVYSKTSDFLVPPPDRAFIFMDEHEDSMDDGFFFVTTSLDVVAWADLPSSRHGGGATMSYVDGHVELKKWLDPRTRKPVEKAKFVPYAMPGNRDVPWLFERATVKRSMAAGY